MSSESTVRDRDAAGFDLIETMRWEPETGFVRFERHLARLYGSARELGFEYDPEAIGRDAQRGGRRGAYAASDPARAVAERRRRRLHATL